MARIRTIKPEFFTSEDIVSLTPLARLFYVSLWCEADREGRLSWKLGTLKMRYLPADDAPIQELAGELIAAGLVVLYEVDGRQYAEIPGFSKHQVINNREQDSVIPPRVIDASCTRESGVSGEGKEGKEGNTRGNAKNRKGPLPKDFAISDRVRLWAVANGYSNLQAHLENFIGAAKAKGYSYVDWDEAFMTAIRKNWAGVESRSVAKEEIL